MRNLLSANFARLWKSPVFWVLEGAAALFAIVVYGLAMVNTHDFGSAWAAERANANFFVEMMYLGPALAIFAGFYTGVEHSDGTIRNKLSAGHLRRNVYLANLLVCAAVGSLLLLTHGLVACAMSLAFLPAALALTRPAWSLFCAACVLVAYAALFTLAAMLDTNRPRMLVVSLAASLALLFAGMMVGSHLRDLELALQTVQAQPDTFVDPEGRYRMLLDMRTLFRVLEALLPPAQIMYLTGREGGTAYLPFCSLGIAAGVTSIGLALFRRRDLK